MSEVAEKIIERASKLREANPSRYGVFRSRPGTPGYVEGGWRLAIWDATEQYYQETGKMPSNKKTRENCTLAHRLRIDPNQDGLYRGYKMQVQAFKAQYHQEGLKVDKPRNPKKPNPRAPTQRKRLPPKSW